MKTKLSELEIVRAFADQLCQRVARSTIRELQRMDSQVFEDDPDIENFWDEICVQVQYEESKLWDAYKESIRALVAGVVDELQAFERGAMWLQTSQGRAWDCEDEGTREPSPIFSGDIVSFIVSDYVLAAAGGWSNRKIRAYIDRISFRD